MSAETTSAFSSRSYLRLAAGYESGIWRSLYSWLARRPRSSEPDAVLFGYASQVTPILVAFTALSALEIPALSLLLPWPAVRYSLLVLGVWGLIWMLGLLAALRVHPHVVADTGLRLRSGFQFDVFIPWSQIVDTRLRRRGSPTAPKLRVQHSDAGASVDIQSTTNVEVTFREPVTVHFIDGRHGKVDTIRFSADAATALVAAAHVHLGRVAQAA